ncbi:MAG TPA: Fic family protein [Candidatus Limnocylindria bacterium]|nr:Fic family protein [Candidatus Limnocylindria bacterium]
MRGRPSRAAIHERLQAHVQELKDRLGGLPLPAEAEQIWTGIWHREAHHSTALEGNTLVLREVEVLLAEGKAVGDKELREYLEVTGYANAAQWVYREAVRSDRSRHGPLLTIQEVRHVHHLVLRDVWAVAPHPNASDAETPGSWRQHDIHPFPSGMRPPTHPLVPAEIAAWLDRANGVARANAPIAESVGAVHAAFERIHPFIDGNGRTGRLLTNLLLIRLGYPPAIIYKRQRREYLRALERADRGDAGPIGEMWARAILDSLVRFVLPSVAGDVKLLPLEALASKDLSVVALRAAARRGTLRAQRQPNGEWRSSKKWVQEYRAGRYSSLRRPRSTAR